IAERLNGLKQVGNENVPLQLHYAPRAAVFGAPFERMAHARGQHGDGNVLEAECIIRATHRRALIRCAKAYTLSHFDTRCHMAHTKTFFLLLLFAASASAIAQSKFTVGTAAAGLGEKVNGFIE